MPHPLMKCVVTTGTGGYDKLAFLEIPVPELEEGEVLIQVLAAGMNNTEINTRLGWYSSSITAATGDSSAPDAGLENEKTDGGWSTETPFPFIQGTDCCGRVVSVAEGVPGGLLGKRVLVRPCIRNYDFSDMETIWMGSDFNGAFAQFVKVWASEVFPVDCDWTDAELGSIPCAYGTAENMLHRAKVHRGEKVLVTGATGGVGSATVQLAKRRGATVIGIAAVEKHAQMAATGVDQLFGRETDLLVALGEQAVDVVVDNVAGGGFSTLLKLLKRGGRLVSSGAIAGPVVEMDMRDMYLKDLTLIGTTAWDEPVFPHLISYIEQGEIQPLVAKVFPLASIVEAQKEFMTKKHVGKFVLLPPQ